MEVVTIEGSVTPCVELARGHRRTVLYNVHVRCCIRRGYFVLVARHGDEEAELAEPDELWAPPAVEEPASIIDAPPNEEDPDGGSHGAPGVSDDQPPGAGGASQPDDPGGAE